MRIGIGITTYNRPECLKKCLDNIYKYSGINEIITSQRVEPLGRFSGHIGDHHITIDVEYDTDEDRKGVAARKNNNLRNLKDCDHIFLFDDDCYPIKDGWVDFFIRKSQREHVLFLNDKLHGRPITMSNISTYYDCGGVFMYITKEHLEKVGAFNEQFTPWGFEHCEWSMRCQDGKRMFFMIKGTEEYLYASDYSDPTHKSSISNEEKQKYFDLNFPKFKEPIKNIYIPLE